MEQESDLVRLGKFIHQTSYERERKEIELDHIKLDWLDLKGGLIHEVKKDDAVEEAHKWQVLYYIYYLKLRGVEEISGEIDYPKLKKRVEVTLTPELEEKLEATLQDIERIVSLPKPPPVEVKFSLCRKCSYLELCHS
jgi:CRISPR-associated exonuclease Cas4